MNNKFPKSFYFKLIFIILTCLFVYFSNHTFIHATIINENLNISESFKVIMKEVMDLPRIEQVDNHENVEVDMQAAPGNQTPYLIEDDVKTLENYQTAEEKASQFNDNFNADGLNEAFNHKVNYMRRLKGWAELSVGSHLMKGTRIRAEQLGQYHYLSGYTVEGNDFRTLFTDIPKADYRLGENLYELYISAGDIHLTTWENPRILADYLYDVFVDSISLSSYEAYQSSLIRVYAEPTDYLVTETPYVRLVVTLVHDTESSY